MHTIDGTTIFLLYKLLHVRYQYIAIVSVAGVGLKQLYILCD